MIGLRSYQDIETPEEMAEEYTAKQNLQNVNPSGIVRCKIADGFLAGLKAGRPQWHDLRKDQNDLPKDGCEVIIKCLGEEEDTWKFFSAEGFPIKTIAWCEIPTFDKE